MLLFSPDQNTRAPLAGQMMPSGPEITIEPQFELLPAFQTPLKLTEEQEAEMTTWAMGRMNDIKRQMGLDASGRVEPGSWLDIRIQNEQTNANDLEWRKNQLKGVFLDSNFTVGDSKRHCRLYAARVRDDLIGTRPFFGAFAQDGTDEDEVALAKESETITQKRIEESNVPGVIREAVRLAAIRNEAVVKVSYVRDATPYRGPARVLVDRYGLPIHTPARGMLIYEKDDFLPDPFTEGLARLEKDPSFSMTQGQYRYKLIPDLEQTMVRYDNVHAAVLDPRDFLCPIDAEDIHTADLVAHLREETPANLNAAFGGYDTFRSYKSSPRPVTGALQPKRHQGERDDTMRSGIERVLVSEVCMRYPIDGVECEIFATFDMVQQKAVFYDYLGNHMSRRPYRVIWGVEREPQRWFGVGVFSMMSHNSLYIDAQFNRYNSADGKSGCIKWANREAVREWREGGAIEVGIGNPVTVDKNFDPNAPIAGVINLNEIKSEYGRDLMKEMQRAGEVQFGVISSADGSAQGLNQSGTATGIMNLERTSNVLIKDSEIDHIEAIEEILAMAVEFLIDNIPQMLVQFDPKTQKISQLSRDEIRGLRRKVKLLLTRSKSAEALVTNEKAEAIWLRYFRLTPFEQYYGRPFYINQLRALEVPDADQRLPEVTWEQVQAWQAQQAAQKEPLPPPSKSIGTKYSDLARSEQEQVLQQAQIKPAPPEEIQAMKQEEQATKLAEAKAKGQGRPDGNPAAA